MNKIFKIWVVGLLWTSPILSSENDNMIFIQGGEFKMGSTVVDAEKPPHKIILDDFYMDRYEVTTAQYCRFLNEMGNQEEEGIPWLDNSTHDCLIITEGDQFKPKPGFENYPAIEVSWYGARAYAAWAGKRLPTEAEWEYAARGGQKSRGFTYSGGNHPDDVAWYKKNAGGMIHPVGTKQCNELGLYDMSGNVFEWTADWYDADYYKKGEVQNPDGPESGEFKVLRGGGWDSAPYVIRCTYRYEEIPATVGEYNFGFRCVRSAGKEKE